MEKIIQPSNIKSAEKETVLSDYQAKGLNNYVLDFSFDMIYSILLTEGKTARSARQGRDFTESEKENLKIRARSLAPIYLKRLQELGFPDKNIDIETHKREIEKLLKK